MAFKDICYNEHVIAISHAMLGPRATLTGYGATTAYPEDGQLKPQRPHRDIPTTPLGPDPRGRCPALGINIPVTGFTRENGATLNYPGTHLVPVEGLLKEPYDPGHLVNIPPTNEMLARQAAVRPPEPMVLDPGDLVLRDIRLWHGGMPNRTDQRRLLLLLFVIDPDYLEGDECGVRGFEVEEGSQDFWQHPTLRTETFVLPKPIDYLKTDMSYPATPLRLDYEKRRNIERGTVTWVEEAKARIQKTGDALPKDLSRIEGTTESGTVLVERDAKLPTGLGAAKL